MPRSTRDRLLDAGTGLLLAAAAAFLIQDRVLPALRGERAVEVGGSLPRELAFEALASRDTVMVPAGATTLLLVLQSSCPACRAVSPAWADLLRRRDPEVRVLAVAMEAPDDGLAYVRSRLPGALAVRPLVPERFLQILRVRAVPTTLVVGPDHTVRYRRSGLLDDVEGERLLALVGADANDPDADPLRSRAGKLDDR